VQNSNLVLTAETRTREAAEPSGEPESLHGRMRGKMGDRVQHAKPEGFEARKQKQAKKRQAQQEFELEAPKQKRRVSCAASLLWENLIAIQSLLVHSSVLHLPMQLLIWLAPTGWWSDEPGYSIRIPSSHSRNTSCI